jgi:arylsulfatase
MYTRWMGNKMWAFGPAKNLVVGHMMTLQEFPPRDAPADNTHAEQQAREDNGLAQ